MAPSAKATPGVTPGSLAGIFVGAGIGLFGAGLLILLLTFGPLGISELGYQYRTWNHAKPQPTPKTALVVTPIDKNFDIIIPKLGANARVIPDVNPFDPKTYEVALTKGVAQARGSAVPGAMGNVFLFAHSSENWFDALKYNSVFYLLPKLTKGDQIVLYYYGAKFTYTVSATKLVDPTDISYLTLIPDKQMLTLMTCWPAGTNLKRFLVFADLSAR